MDKIITAREKIVSDSRGEWNTQGIIDPCPVCEKGELHYQVHGNGHIWANCRLDGEHNNGCVSWME